MLSLFQTLSLRYLRRHWSRTVLIVLSIALGVTTWVATDALHAALKKAVRDAAMPLRGTADLYVLNSGAGLVDAARFAPRLERVPGVKRVEPVIIVKNVLVSKGTAAEPAPQSSPPLRGGVRVAERRATMQRVALIGFPLPGKKSQDGALQSREITVADLDEQSIARDFLRRRLPAQLVPPPLRFWAQRGLDKYIGGVSVLIGEGLDDNYLRGARSFTVQVGPRRQAVYRVGTVRASGVASMLGGQVVLMEWRDAARLMGKPGMAHRLDVTLEEGADPEAVRSAIDAALDGAAEAQTPQAADQRLQDLTGGLEIGFKVCGAFALVVGMFLVYNAMSVSVAERRHDIGILRSVGATRPQVRMLFLGEAVVLGLTGAVLGIPFGLGLAHLALGPMQKALRGIFLPLHGGEVSATPGLILAATVGGVATALLAALVPASQAASEQPADAVRRAPPTVSAAYRLLQIASSLALIVLGCSLVAARPYLTEALILQGSLALLALGLPLAVIGYRQAALAQPATEDAHGRWRVLLAGAVLTLTGAMGLVLRDALMVEKGTYAALILVMVGALLAAPILSTFVARLLQPLARQFLPIESRLAADNLVRSPGRTGLVTAALAAGVALMVQTAGMIRSNEVGFLGWIDRTVRADLYLSSGGPINAAGQLKAFQPGFDDALKTARLPDGSRLLPEGTKLVGDCYRYLDWEPSYHVPADGRGVSRARGSTKVFLTLTDAAEYYEATAARFGADDELRLWQRLGEEPGTALISENFAMLHGVRVGDRIRLKAPAVQWRVIGTLSDFNWSRGTIYVDRVRNRAAFDGEPANSWKVFLPPGSDVTAVREQLLKSNLATRYDLLALTRAEIRDNVRDMIRRLYSVAYTQELVVGVVAVLGVVTALLISVLGRRRELGLLRALGCTRGQVVHAVLAEAVLIGLVGTALGVLVGLPMEWYVVRVILFEEAGFLFPVSIPWAEAGIIALLSVLTAALAGLGPALHAMRMRIGDAIAYE